MSKMVDSVEITFENLDFVKLPISSFGYFSIRDIADENGCADTNAVHQYTVANSLDFTLLPETDKEASDLCGDFSGLRGDDNGLFARLMRRDITQIALYYLGGGIENYLVPWEDEADNEYQNKLQAVFTDAEGRLCVSITQNPVD